jgi:NAD(P)H-nitrite reductase large subunit
MAVSDPTPARYVCRCEEIEHSAMVEAIGEGVKTLNDLKRRTRGGMGVCQGVYCLPEMAALLCDANGTAPDEIAPMTSRPPARLLTLDELSRLAPGSGVD